MSFLDFYAVTKYTISSAFQSSISSSSSSGVSESSKAILLYASKKSGKAVDRVV